MDEVADLDVAPLLLDEVFLGLVINESVLIVLFIVLAVPHDILNCVLDHRYGDDHGEGRSHDGLASANRNHLNHLHEGDDEEVEVGELAELGKQIEGDEVVPGVLGGRYVVAALLLAHGSLLGQVDHDAP